MILRFAQYDKYNRGFGGKAPEDSSHLIIRVFLFRFCFFFFHRNKKEKVNISLSVGLAKPTYVFLIYISLFNQTLSPTPSPKGEGTNNPRHSEGCASRFLNTSKQFYPKNLLRVLIISNPLPYPSPLERGLIVPRRKKD